MPKRKWAAATMAALLLAGLVAGLFHFGGLTEPSSYPHMSSLNTGPDGSKLLFDSLTNLPALAVTRNYLPFSRWRPSATTVLLLGVAPFIINSASKTDLVELEQLSQPDNRIVFAIDDIAPRYEFLHVDVPKQSPAIKTRWGIQIADISQKGDKNANFVLEHDASWSPAEGLRDAVQKSFGKHGTIIIALHSADFSNKKFASDATVLAEIPALIGNHSAINFDETHLGIEESGSIAGLLRRYRLQGLVAGLLILVGLFIWNQAVSFPPPSRFDYAQDKQILGADARGVFSSLIAHHLTPQALMESCVAEWNRVKPQQKIRANFSSKTDAVSSYRQIQEKLPKKRIRL